MIKKHLKNKTVRVLQIIVQERAHSKKQVEIEPYAHAIDSFEIVLKNNPNKAK